MLKLLSLICCISLAGCAGFRVPFTDYQVAHWMFKADHDEINADCIEKPQLQALAKFLETRHLEYLRSRNASDAVNIKEFKEVLGSKCESLLAALSTTEIQQELFGTATNIPNPEKLRELGGLLFAYLDITADAGIRPTLHLEKEYTGPNRRLVAIYQLTDGRIVHLQYSGKDDVARRTLYWPIVEFLGIAVEQGVKAFVP